MAQEGRVCYSFWGGISFLMPPLPSPCGGSGILCAFPYLRCKYTARTRRLMTPSLRSYWVTVYYGAPPVPLWGKWHPLRLSIFAMQIHGTDAASDDAFASLLLGDGVLWSPSRPLWGKWHPLRLSVFAKCKYTARMRHMRMPCREIGLRLLNKKPFAGRVIY